MCSQQNRQGPMLFVINAWGMDCAATLELVEDQVFIWAYFVPLLARNDNPFPWHIIRAQAT